jgi:transketolase
MAINTIRCLAIDMVEAAGCGHPGAPMGQAALAYTLWTRYLRFDPDDPEWPNRDRFVLSCGHASALLYALLHLSGFDLNLAELRGFRQLGSKTPGHPEHGHTPGVETTTGPLGQGVGNAVGMALARRHLAAEFNRPDLQIFDYRIWALASDGDLMEGISSEACSLAGHLGLGALNVVYDDNRITIDGSTDLSFSEDVEQRFQAYGWHTSAVEDGNDLRELEQAFSAAQRVEDRPSLVRVRTHIGFGSPQKQDTNGAHGEALGADEARATKIALGWPLEPTFHVPDAARQLFQSAAGRGRVHHRAWSQRLERYREEYPQEAAELSRRSRSTLPEGWEESLPAFQKDSGSMATRKASGKVLNALAARLPELVGGSADLTGSNNTFIDGAEVFNRDSPIGRNLHFGVREHAMGAILNGMALSKLIRPYGGTFLVFSDYMRASIRMAAIMKLPVIYVFTHDSVFLGEDGPTHQPESHLASLRAIPGLTVLRPADAKETACAWACTLENTSGPTALILTRQDLPTLAETQSTAAEGVRRGGYVLLDTSGQCNAILIATGSEVSLALAAQAELGADGIGVRVVSMPSWELFDAQPETYRQSVLPDAVSNRIAVEAGSSMGWGRYVGAKGGLFTLDRFGASAPAFDIARDLGFTSAALADRVRATIGIG